MSIAATPLPPLSPETIRAVHVAARTIAEFFRETADTMQQAFHSRFPDGRTVTLLLMDDLTESEGRAPAKQ